MKKILSLMLALLSVSAFLKAETTLPAELQEYKLQNGLTVILWEDHEQPDVEGYVVTRAGAIDEPQEYTGLAHYLEHMLFKGTQQIGAVDWEKEKPLYDSIIILYDQYALETDDAKRQELATRINKKSMEAAKYSTTEDFFNILDGIGAEGVNAYTSYDVTCYHNSFPAFQMQKWLTIFSDRLINPVFRTFQAELENVFEEYNMYANNPNTQVQNALFEKLYEGHPYERNVIGKPEHLKNPRLSKLIEFYNTWYVPNNMALIIVGDFNAEETKPMIESTFGRLQPKELPARAQYTEASFAGNPTFNFKMGYYPMGVWGYKAVKITDDDADALEFVTSLLNNGMQTGLLDKLMLDGKISMAGASCDLRRDQGRIIIEAVPYYDINQRQYESNAATKKMIMTEIDKIKSGDIPDWLIASVKKEYEQSYKLAFESGSSKMSQLVHCFTYGMPLTEIFEENDKIQALTKEQIAAVAKKYFDADFITIAFEEGKVKANTLPKPKIEPLDPIKGVETEYSKNFKKLPEGQVVNTFNNFADVQVQTIQPNVKLHYTPNTKNDIFSLTLRYGVGTEKKPMLEYAVALMNTAGTMIGNLDAQAFRRRLAELGGRVGYGISDNYFTIQIIGEDE
ncbi:MAG: insulinase family protein, partial [Bacteroidales bacterium]|nr:insulinase family protein [Candidatus Colicola faecequi]